MPFLKSVLKLFGDPKKKTLKQYQSTVQKILAHEKSLEKLLSLENLPEQTERLKARIAEGESLNALLPEAFATVKVACRLLCGKSWEVRGEKQSWNMVPFDVQLLGGIALHEGKIAEMKTGEGKTLVATLPVYLNALTQKGVHIITVNEYLAERDAEWMGGLFRSLGLTVGVLRHGDHRDQKKEAYKADITYGTNTEFGFDYLRSQMVFRKDDQVQGPLHYAIIDEVDSILIDEARTPLTISGPSERSTEKYEIYAKLVHDLESGIHFTVDEKQKIAMLTEEGIEKMETLLGVDNLYTESGFQEVHQIEQALKALTLYQKDVDYVVRDNQVILIDEFTGRLMPGRRLGRGLHQAIEAKENVPIKKESRTLATITIQNYFLLYEKLAGMTGTAETEEEEFEAIYDLSVLPIPTAQAIRRQDKTDLIYKNQAAKFRAITEKVAEIHATGQPILIGTASVHKSEYLSDLLQKKGIPHQVLNAKQHEREAEIIAQAGQKNAVTIATNMAGRGVDIKLEPGTPELGGLYVIGSERHEARRIDNQLRGRSGRQGDPGVSQFYVAMDDDLMRIFGGSRMEAMMSRFNLPEDVPIEMGLLTRFIESAQKRVEGHYFDIRKHLVEYDNVMNRHREIIYKKRQELLEMESTKNHVLLLIEKEAEAIALNHPNDPQAIVDQVLALRKDPSSPLAPESLSNLSPEATIDRIKTYLYEEYDAKCATLSSEEYARQAERIILLRVLDTEWVSHLTELQEIRQAVGLLSYGQRSPLMEYKNQAFASFEAFMSKLDHESVKALFHVRIEIKPKEEPTAPLLGGSPFNHITTNEDQIEESISGPSDRKNSEMEKEAKVGRNDPCPCGSGKKFKKCHGA